ncbi:MULTISPECIES: universal stress protein [Vibrio]|uniref:Universal stress protein n=2 Tax=Vibrio TaxID=662 RepID=A0A7X4LPR6_9VIBR|nr:MULTISPECIES: universal stress protein [Vibrio]MBF9000639.1 universal stress protein [Vibrio nitrifigilis]MZI95879.1 universal stress protein [Vibrio eleionomae]
MSYQHILVAVDLTESSKKLISKAVEQAKPHQAKLSIVYVDIDHIISNPKEEQHYLQQLDELVAHCDYPIAETSVVIGELHMKVAGLVKSDNIDLVVCGHHHTLMSRMFSSAPKLVNNVDADLLVVHLD